MFENSSLIKKVLVENFTGQKPGNFSNLRAFKFLTEKKQPLNFFVVITQKLRETFVIDVAQQLNSVTSVDVQTVFWIANFLNKTRIQ